MPGKGMGEQIRKYGASKQKRAWKRGILGSVCTGEKRNQNREHDTEVIPLHSQTTPCDKREWNKATQLVLQVKV